MEKMDSKTILSGITEEARKQYVKSISKDGNIQYTDAFYDAMREQINSGKSHVEAYNELGFDTNILSEARANCAGTRAMKPKAEVPFSKDISKYDANITFEEMLIKWKNKKMDKEDLYANMAARLIVLDNMNSGLKKNKRF